MPATQTYFSNPKTLTKIRLNHRVILRFHILSSRSTKKQEYPLVSIRIERPIQDISSLELGQTAVRYKFQTGDTSFSMLLFAARV